MASPAVFNELLNTTINYWKKTPVSQIKQHNALRGWMVENGNIRTDIDGGQYLQIPLIMNENDTIENFSGYDLLQTGTSEPTKTITFPWSSKSITIAISGEEMRINNGKAKVVSIAKIRAEAARDTADNRLAIEWYSNGTIADGLVGLPGLIKNDGLGTVGGLDSSLYPNWRNQFRTSGAPGTLTALNVRGHLQALEIDCTVGNVHPDLTVCTNDIFVALQDATSLLVRNDNPYMGGKGATLGFRSIMLASGHEIVHDANVNFAYNGERAYMLCTKNIYEYVHPDGNWEETPNMTPINQDSLIRRLIWMGGIAIENRRQMGVLFTA